MPLRTPIVLLVPLAFAAGLFGTGCPKHEAPDPAAGASSAAPPHSAAASATQKAPAAAPPALSATPLAIPIPVTIKGQPRTLTSGVAVWVNRAWLVVHLSDTPVDCAHARSGEPVSVSVSAGPDRKFFVGSEVPAQVTFPAFYDQGSVTMTRVGLKAGDDVEGSFRYDDVDPKGLKTSAAGAFRVHLCEDAPALPALASTVKSEDVGGTLGKKPWVARSAIAYAINTPTHGKYLERVVFFAEPQPTCHWLAEPRESLDIDVARAKEDSAGHYRPVYAMHRQLGPDGGIGPSVTVGSVAWIRLANVSFDKGATIRGELALDAPKMSSGEPGDHVEGKFAAILCP